MKRPKLSRRRFLKLAGAGGLAIAPLALGAYEWAEAEGESLPLLSPYASCPAEITSPTSTPLLIVAPEDGDNPFAALLGEILRTEGLVAFETCRASALTSEMLAASDTAILAEGPLTDAQAELIAAFVSEGGRLVGLRPDKRLRAVFGVDALDGEEAEGAFVIDASHALTAGITPEPLQFHGTADRYDPDNAVVLGWLTDRTGNERRSIGLSINTYGAGLAVLWAFDLARCIAYLRQGNPALRHNPQPWSGIRAVNMFVDWIDLDRLPVPQADELQRLFANVLNGLQQARRPLPRLWYFPAGAPGMLIATGDDHASPHDATEAILSLVEEYGGEFTVYYTPQEIRRISRALRRASYLAAPFPWLGEMAIDRFQSPPPFFVKAWRGRGHEFALHPFVDETSPIEGLEPSWAHYWQQFTGQGYGPVPPTTRTHRIAWTGWVETARVQASYGIRLNLDYYHWGPLFKRPTGEWAFGYLTGSGLPMRFIDDEGRLLNIYQQLTEIADDHMLELAWGAEVGGVALLPAEQAAEIARQAVRVAADRYPSALVAQFHVDPFATEPKYRDRAELFMRAMLEEAVLHGFPIWSAVHWLSFVEARHTARMTGVTWDRAQGVLGLRLTNEQTSAELLEVLLPRVHGGLTLTEVTVDGVVATTSERRVGGVTYAAVAASAAAHTLNARYGA